MFSYVNFLFETVFHEKLLQCLEEVSWL